MPFIQRAVESALVLLIQRAVKSVLILVIFFFLLMVVVLVAGHVLVVGNVLVLVVRRSWYKCSHGALFFYVKGPQSNARPFCKKEF